jgi:MFS family permease
VVPGLIALVFLVVVLRGLPRAEPSAAPVAAPGPETPAPLAPLVMLAALTAARLPETLLLLRLQEQGLALAVVPLLWGGMHVLRSAAAYPAGRLADRVGARLTLAVGSLGYAACLAAFAGVASVGAAVAAFLAIGIAGGVLEPAERVLVASSGASRQGRAFGTYQSLAGVGGLAVALALGWLYQRFDGETALLAGAGLVGVLLPLWLLFGSGVGPGGGSRSLAGIIRDR